MKYAALVVFVFGAAIARAEVTPPKPESLEQQHARGVLERWVQAQNRGDFAAYQALYAPGFSGVRRSGDKVVELDRAGWMRDRARMFKKKMRVRADEVRAGQNVQLTELQFRQTWSSANYRDVGPKRLTIVDEGHGPLIVREEMLQSAKSVRVEPLDDAEVELLHCMYKNVDAHWRLVDDASEVISIEVTAYARGTAFHVVFDDHEALGLCQDGKLIARNDSFSLPSIGGTSCQTELHWSMESEFKELKPDVTPLTFVGTLGVVEADDDAPEGCEVSISGKALALFVPVKGSFTGVFSMTSLNDGCDFSDCTNQACSVETGKPGRGGWYDLVETCDVSERAGRHEKRAYQKITTYKWNGIFYNDFKSKVVEYEVEEE